jgi:hypothetical protein
MSALSLRGELSLDDMNGHLTDKRNMGIRESCQANWRGVESMIRRDVTRSSPGKRGVQTDFELTGINGLCETVDPMRSRNAIQALPSN